MKSRKKTDFELPLNSSGVKATVHVSLNLAPVVLIWFSLGVIFTVNAFKAVEQYSTKMII
jgi:hypothetical protein